MTMWTQPVGSRHCEALVCQNPWLLLVLTFIVSLLQEASWGKMAANGNHETSILSRSWKEMERITLWGTISNMPSALPFRLGFDCAGSARQTENSALWPVFGYVCNTEQEKKNRSSTGTLSAVFAEKSPQDVLRIVCTSGCQRSPWDHLGNPTFSRGSIWTQLPWIWQSLTNCKVLHFSP